MSQNTCVILFWKQFQFKRGAEYVNEYVKTVDIETENFMKKEIEIIKKEDSVLGEKLFKLYDKQCEFDRISEEIIKYVLDTDKISNYLEKVKSVFGPLEHKLAESIKKLEVSDSWRIYLHTFFTNYFFLQ